ncbi:MAG: hypothetical protein KDA31_11825 [Phycisphaerales bacterium]|nr:hypothetical protein [Phycisphaerales bacterium]MCB9835801.1 hypothetical protein [Phycisphaera sp.]
MPTALRTPVAFLVLTVALIGWISAWTIPHDYYSDLTLYSNEIHRPLYWLANRALGKSYRKASAWEECIIPSTETCIIETDSGCRIATLSRNGAYLPTTYKGERILSAGIPDRKFTTHEFGLLAPVAYRFTTTTELIPAGRLPLIDPALVSGIDRFESTASLKYPYPAPASHQWQIKPVAAVHDTLLLLTLLSWSISLISIPKWTLWHRLTPAQRRRARGCCPRCSYNLEGLATPTCPECGNQVGSAPVS